LRNEEGLPPPFMVKITKHKLH